MGGSFSLISPDFETGGTGACTGNEINLVRTIAAGGLKDSNGFSQVIYAGTNGEGPLISTTPIGGHVWVTTNVDGGPPTWNDETQAINPQGFPISSITLDHADPLGNTAYVTIMGFHTSHVWKTTNAGVSWTDFTANLPDAPANVIVVDSGASLSNGTLYVCTDVGVFASSTGSRQLGRGWEGGRPEWISSGCRRDLAADFQLRWPEALAGCNLWPRHLGMEPDHNARFSDERREQSIDHLCLANCKFQRH